MKYFMHDANAHQDEKLAELFIRFGYEGYGLFFAILERLAFQEKPVKTAVLKKQLSVGKKLEKAWSFMEDIGLISSENGETFNNNLLKFAEKYQKVREKNSKRIAQWREKQQVPETVTRNEQVRNTPNKTRLDKTKLELKKTNKKSADADASSESDLFSQFYELYEKKFDRKKAEAKFNRLSRADQLAILEHVPLYVKSTPNPRYRKNPLTYLNGDCWKDPIDLSKSAGTTTSQQPTAKRPSAPGQVR